MCACVHVCVGALCVVGARIGSLVNIAKSYGINTFSFVLLLILKCIYMLVHTHTHTHSHICTIQLVCLFHFCTIYLILLFYGAVQYYFYDYFAFMLLVNMQSKEWHSN